MLDYKTAKLVMDGVEYPIQRLSWGSDRFDGLRYTAEGSIPRLKLADAVVAHGLTDDRRRQELIDFAKTGAPPALPSFAEIAAAEGPISDHVWVYALREREAAFNEDVLPAGFKPKAPREFYAPTQERCVPRMTKPKLWIDPVKDEDKPLLTFDEYVRRSCEKLGVSTPDLYRRKRPASLSDFAIGFHASNQRWWRDLKTGAKLDRNMGELLMLVVSEIAEAMEGERKDLMDDHLPHRKMAEVELADAVIRIADIVGSLGRGFATVFERRVLELAATDATSSGNKGEQLRRICVPICSVGNIARNGQFLANKLARSWHRIEVYATKYGYDLWGAVFEKMEYNKTRADHTPEARLAANGKKF